MVAKIFIILGRIEGSKVGAKYLVDGQMAVCKASFSSFLTIY
jgi:hypothetical protein